MVLTMLYFAWVREAIGVSEEVVEPPAEVETVSDLIDWLSLQSEGHRLAFIDRNRD